MDTLFLGQNKITLPTVDSTNNYAAKLIKMSFVPDGTVIMAHNQTHGKGQRENIWTSSPGENLLMSVIVFPKQLITKDNYLISMITTLAAKESISAITGHDNIHVKWPNDLILNDKKVGGILIENTIVKGVVKCSIIGIGINVNQNDLDYYHATSLRKETSKITDLDLFLKYTCQNLEKWYLKLPRSKDLITSKFNECLWKKHALQKLTIDGELFTGSVLRVTAEGCLEIESNSKIYSSANSEIKILYE